MIYNMAYVDGKTGISKVKRFAVTAITRDKEYDLTSGNPRSKVLYFSANPNSESEIVNVMLSPASGARNKIFDFDFAELEIKGRASQGNILSKYAIKQIKFKEKGASTLGGRDIWYDEIQGRLNVDERGKYLGSFDLDDTILVITSDGNYEITNFELTNRYDAEHVMLIEKFRPDAIVSAVHYDMVHKSTYIKRFLIETTTQGKKFSFISEGRNSKLLLVTTQLHPIIEVATGKKTNKRLVNIDLVDFVDVRGWKAIGNKLNEDPIHELKLISEDALPDIMAMEHPEDFMDPEDMVIIKKPMPKETVAKPKSSVATHPKKLPATKGKKGGKGSGGQMKMF
jgi:topoisomerase-4 subunit A